MHILPSTQSTNWLRLNRALYRFCSDRNGSTNIDTVTIRSVQNRQDTMSNPAIYALTNHYPRIHTTSLLKEYSNKIKIMGGACMDIGCGPGDVTTEILLPALHQSARLIGKNLIKYKNIISM